MHEKHNQSSPASALYATGLGGIALGLSAEGVPQSDRPTRAEVEAFEVAAKDVLAGWNVYRTPTFPGPAPRPGVPLDRHLEHLRVLGYGL